MVNHVKLIALKKAMHPTATQKATGTATVGISIATIAAVISTFIIYTSGMPLLSKVLLGIAGIIIAALILVGMYYTNKKYGIDWVAIIQYIVELVEEIQRYLDDNKPGPGPEPVVTPPTANYTVTVNAGPLPQTAAFKDASTGATSWSWAFGDGATAVIQNPTHAYNMYGDYDATLTVSNSAGSNAVTKTIKVAEPPMPAGTMYANWNGATVVLIMVPAWRNGGGKILKDGGVDDPSYYPIVFKNSDTDMLHLCQQGYFEVAANLVHSMVDDPFAQPETKKDVQNKMEASEQPMEFLMQWFAAKRTSVDVNYLKCTLILSQSIIDQMKAGDGSAYRDFVNGLPLQPDGQPGGLILAYANYLKNHDKAAQIQAATPMLDANF